jgi:hypothetical protein
MNFYSASVATLWTTVFGSFTPPAGSRRGIVYGGRTYSARSGGKVRATSENDKTPCQGLSLKRHALLAGDGASR